MHYIPAGARVLVKLDPVEERKAGSIFIPGQHSELSRHGTVLACGAEAKRYKAGERIFCGYHAGNVIDSIGQTKADTLRIMDESEIWGWALEKDKIDE